MKLTSKELFELNIVDEIIEEPIGGAHRDREKTLENIKTSLEKNLKYFQNLNENEIISERKNKFLNIGRGDGFTTKPESSQGLTLQKNNFSIIIEKVFKNKRILFSSLIIVSLFLGIIYLL